jgi:hypothetical protein
MHIYSVQMYILFRYTRTDAKKHQNLLKLNRQCKSKKAYKTNFFMCRLLRPRSAAKIECNAWIILQYRYNTICLLPLKIGL